MNYRIFGEIYCDKTLDQMNSAMSQPFALKGSLMPDAHAGYSLPIGGVVLTPHNTVVPAWVGYDIGCGMCATRLNLDVLTKKQLNAIKDRIVEEIPMGTKKHNDNGNLKVKNFTELGEKICQTRGAGQLGTLGGGNHFIEIGQDEVGLIWICIHSGSRGVGHAVATHYMKEAAALAGVTCGNVEGHYPLQVKDGDIFSDYLKDMQACVTWARMNRGLMMNRIIRIMQEVLGRNIEVVDRIDNTHNTANAIPAGRVHRKGATSALKDERGIIPGNMRDGFFVVKGLGNKDSLESASHGAGRVMSRGEAKAAINFDSFQEEMKHVVTNISQATVDEAPDAYKSIFEVMESQADCVDILHHVTPLLNLKG